MTGKMLGRSNEPGGGDSESDKVANGPQPVSGVCARFARKSYSDSALMDEPTVHRKSISNAPPRTVSRCQALPGEWSLHSERS